MTGNKLTDAEKAYIADLIAQIEKLVTEGKLTREFADKRIRELIR